VTLTVKGKDHGTGTLTSSMVTDVIAGKTIVSTKITVNRH
jgi:NifU-like protein involved in Fe-S cluster formation